MKALVGAYNQEKALVGAFSVIVKTDCETDGSFYSTSIMFEKVQNRNMLKHLTDTWSVSLKLSLAEKLIEKCSSKIEFISFHFLFYGGSFILSF